MKNPLSFAAASLVTLLLFLATAVYYPKYTNTGTEAVISWDVCGYYYYLPAFFIYKDPKQLSFTEAVMNDYRPSGSFDMAMRDASGNYVMKYSSGQALMFLPSFVIGHLAAKALGYPADGFSLPYQLAISFGSLLFCLIGFWVLRRLLLRRYDDRVVALTLIGIGIGTNYFEYASISAQMTHGYLFTVYCLLILCTERFYKRPNVRNAVAIGGLVGLCALTRPTEILSALVPLLWGIGFPLANALVERVRFFKAHAFKIAAAAAATLGVGFVQLAYWKYATGKWIVYSYGDQSFSWLHPHLAEGLWSYNNGWLLYSPMMYAGLFGIAFLFLKRSNLAWMCLCFSAVFIYVAFAWDIWWYGGSLGQRTMVQAYPVMSFAFSAFVVRVLESRWWKYLALIIGCFFVYYNLWLVHQAHRGGLYKTGETTRAYFWRTFLTYEKIQDDLKLLDTNESFNGQRAHVNLIYQNDFEADSSGTCTHQPVEGMRSVCLAPEAASNEYGVALPHGDGWMRVYATFRCSPKEWDTWKMPQFIVRCYNGSEKLKEKMIRVHRLMNEGETKEVFLDIRIPGNTTHVTASVWNASQDKPTTFDLLRFETFNER